MRGVGVEEPKEPVPRRRGETLGRAQSTATAPTSPPTTATPAIMPQSPPAGRSAEKRAGAALPGGRPVAVETVEMSAGLGAHVSRDE